jgi:hypothetical protein
MKNKRKDFGAFSRTTPAAHLVQHVADGRDVLTDGEAAPRVHLSLTHPEAAYVLGAITRDLRDPVARESAPVPEAAAVLVTFLTDVLEDYAISPGQSAGRKAPNRSVHHRT